MAADLLLILWVIAVVICANGARIFDYLLRGEL